MKHQDSPSRQFQNPNPKTEYGKSCECKAYFLDFFWVWVSESSVPNRMRSRSAKSRLHETIKVGNITDDEAISYSSCMCPNATKEVATNAVRLVGGRFNDLVAAAHYIQKERK